MMPHIEWSTALTHAPANVRLEGESNYSSRHSFGVGSLNYQHRCIDFTKCSAARASSGPSSPTSRARGTAIRVWPNVPVSVRSRWTVTHAHDQRRGVIRAGLASAVARAR